MLQNLVDLKIKPVISTFDDYEFYLNNDVYNIKYIIVDINAIKNFNIINKSNDAKLILIKHENSMEKILNKYDYLLEEPINTTDIYKLFQNIYLTNKIELINFNNNTDKPQISKDLHITNDTYNNELSNSPPTDFKIIIAEDNQANQHVIEKILNKLGYFNLKLVQNGVEMINEIEKHSFDVALVDLKMDVMDGITAVEKLIDNKNNTDLPIFVAVTASISKEIKDKCYEIGMNGYITKPIDISELQTILNVIVKNKIINNI